MNLRKTLISTFFFQFVVFHLLFSQTIELASPDGRLNIVILTEDQLSYKAYYDDVILYEQQELYLQTKNITYPQKPRPKKLDRRSIHKELSPEVPLKTSQIVDHCNELELKFSKEFSIAFRLYNDGIAYRFKTNLSDEQTIVDEGIHLVFPENTVTYFPEESSFFSHNERYYVYADVDTLKDKQFCSLPVLFQNKENINILFNESDLIDYPGTWLEADGNGNLKGIFPPYALETEQKNDRSVVVSKGAEYIAKTKGERTYPWRYFVISPDDKGLLLNQMSYLLASPSKIEDHSWIRPGKVAWDWWNDNNVYNVEFRAGVNTETYKYYIDFAADHGIEYIILDEGWYPLGDLLSLTEDIDMEAIMAHARKRDVGIILWVIWKTLDDQLMEAMDLFESWGIAGLKIDFMQRDDQWMVDYYHRIAEEAAKRKFLIDYHGSYKPAGLHRTWPNVLTREGVRGLEQSKWSDLQTPEHNVTLPFIRMVAGPMDYTPGAMVNANKKNYNAIWSRPMSMGTRCHQLAMYVIYESPLQMLCDNPTNYLKEKECMEFLSTVPVVWDETIVMEAKIGEYVGMARRKANDWYIGYMGGKEAREFTLKLDFLPEGEHTLIIYEDGINADRNAQDYRRRETRVRSGEEIKVRLAAGGGYVGWIKEH